MLSVFLQHYSEKRIKSNSFKRNLPGRPSLRPATEQAFTACAKEHVVICAVYLIKLETVSQSHFAKWLPSTVDSKGCIGEIWKAKVDQSSSPDQVMVIISFCDKQAPGVFQPVLTLLHSASSIFLAADTVIQQWPGPPPGASQWKYRGANFSEATTPYRLPHRLPLGSPTRWLKVPGFSDGSLLRWPNCHFWPSLEWQLPQLCNV